MYHMRKYMKIQNNNLSSAFNILFGKLNTYFNNSKYINIVEGLYFGKVVQSESGMFHSNEYEDMFVLCCI